MISCKEKNQEKTMENKREREKEKKINLKRFK